MNSTSVRSTTRDRSPRSSKARMTWLALERSTSPNTWRTRADSVCSHRNRPGEPGSPKWYGVGSVMAANRWVLLNHIPRSIPLRARSEELPVGPTDPHRPLRLSRTSPRRADAHCPSVGPGDPLTSPCPCSASRVCHGSHHRTADPRCLLHGGQVRLPSAALRQVESGHADITGADLRRCLLPPALLGGGLQRRLAGPGRALPRLACTR